ncbi:exo-alpha-sialidase [Paenibacillus amylolyticus]|uniref:exo-alpha-sialidase n=1 Tax=Paenibacillus amylolyticus TaxID=1451 RepID=UPI003EB7493E
MTMMADKQYVFREGQHFQSSHASTIAVLPSGVVFAAWFVGSYEKSSDTTIWMIVQEQDGSWSAPCKVADEEGIAHWNPVLYVQDGSLVLFYKVGHEITDWHTYTWKRDRVAFWKLNVQTWE